MLSPVHVLFLYTPPQPPFPSLLSSSLYSFLFFFFFLSSNFQCTSLFSSFLISTPFLSIAPPVLFLHTELGSSDEVSLEQESEDDVNSSRCSLDKQSHHRANTTMHVCWHRNTSVSMSDHSLAVEVALRNAHSL